MKNQDARPILLFFFLSVAMLAKSQTNWHELRSYGVNSFSTQTIHALAEDFNYQIVYAGIGSDVFRWKGGNTAWEKLGTGSTALNADGVIYTVATDPSHNVYAAGWFTNANGRGYVAKWDANVYVDNKWVELGGLNGLNASGPIYSVISDSTGNIYAAGSFISKTGSHYVAKFNGTSWSELGTGVNALKANNAINALCTDLAGNIYAAGDFTNSEGKKYVAKWDGNSWTEMGAGTTGLNANASIKSISTDKEGHVCAAGQFTNAAGNYYVAKWSGSKWEEPGAGAGSLNFNGIIYSVITDIYGQVYTAGDFTDATGARYVAEWNGTVWDTIGANKLSANNTIYSITIDNRSRVFAAGLFTNAIGYKYVADCASIINTWQETAATGIGALDGNNVLAIATNYTADSLYVSGCYSTSLSGMVSKWGDSTWSDVGALQSQTCVNFLVTDKNGNMYASGKFDGYEEYVAKWDGSKWAQLGTAEEIRQGMGQISGMAIDSAGNIYITGYFADTNGKYYVAKWDGSHWSEVGTGANALNGEEQLSGLCVDKNGNIYVCVYKYFNYYVARWDGSTWALLTDGTDSPLDKIYTIVSDSDGGVYATMSDWTGTYITKWNGAHWKKVPNATYKGLYMFDRKNNLLSLFDNRVHRFGGDGWHEVGEYDKANISVMNLLYADNKNNYYSIGQNNSQPGTRFVVKYEAANLNAPLITYVANKCQADNTAKGKLYNPPTTGTITVLQDGIELPYNAADSSFEYFTKGQAIAGTHRIVATYANGANVLTDSTSYKVTPIAVAVVSITTPTAEVCANTLFTITCHTNVVGATYQWYLNNWPCIYNCNDSIITTTLVSENINVYCQVTTPAGQCYTAGNVSSNSIFMKIGISAPSVSITSNDADNIVCTGQAVVFTALPVNEGSGARYQWKNNGVNVGGDSGRYVTQSLKNKDKIEVVLTKSVSCSTQDAASNIIEIIKNEDDIALTDTLKEICSDATTGVSIGVSPANGYAYSWSSLPAGYTSTISDIVVLPLVNTVYSLLQTNTSTGCTSMAAVSVLVNDGCKAAGNAAYPNPANGYVSIALDGLPAVTDVYIFQLINQGGTIILSQRLTNINNTINVQAVAAGLYQYIVTKNGAGINDGKLIIMH